MKSRILMTAMILTVSLYIIIPETLVAGSEMKDILAQSDTARGNAGGIQWVIEIESIENKRKRKNTLRLKARDFKSLATFLAPAKVKGRKVLQIDRNMWFIKPGLRKPVSISPRQKLMGAAAYGDIASTNYAGDYNISGSSEDNINGEPCHRLTLVAKDKKVTYDKIEYWISRDKNVGIKAEFYTISGKMLKWAAIEYGNKIKNEGKISPFVSKMTIHDAIIEANITTLTYSKVKLKKIPDSTFNINLLLR